MKVTTKPAAAAAKISKLSSTVMNQKSRKQDLRKALLKRMCKTFRDPLKRALKPHELYIITKCSIKKSKYSDVMYIDVVPALGGDVIETYFAELLTKKIVESCEAEGGNYEELLPGVQFTYQGEVTSKLGHTYARVDFAMDETNEEDGDEDVGPQILFFN